MKEFFANVRQELKKIAWPTDNEMKKYSIQVFVFMIVLSLFFFGIDAGISAGMSAVTPTPEPFFPPFVEEYDYDEPDVDFDYIDDYDYENGEEYAE